VLDLSKPAYAIYTEFNYGAYIVRMTARHPGWTEAQLKNVLYWQGTVRKMNRAEVRDYLKDHPEMMALYCPEATGVNITETMKNAGVVLEWPPVKVARVVTLVGHARWKMTDEKKPEPEKCTCILSSWPKPPCPIHPENEPEKPILDDTVVVEDDEEID